MRFDDAHPPVLYGGDYNPEQYNFETVDEDIALMHQAGVTTVTINVFGWALSQPTEDQLDVSWVVELMDRLHEGNIGVILGTGTASPPAWLANNYPDSLPVDREGRRLKFGSRQQYCPTSPEYLAHATTLVSALVEAVADHPSLHMWHVNNEYGCHVWECFCDRCEQRFQEYLADRFADIDEINKSWGTAFWSQRYNDFSEIPAPGPMPAFANPAHMVAWKEFCSHNLLELYLAEADIIRAHDDEHPITTNFMGLFPHVDYFEWAQHIDVISDDSYPDPASPSSPAQIAFDSDLMRSLKKKPFYLMEQAPSAVQWRKTNVPKPLGLHQLWSLQRVAHGADAILHFQWRQSIKGAETFHSAMLPHAGLNTRGWKETLALGSALSKLPDVTGSMPKPEVAILFSWRSEWARQACVGPNEKPFGAAARDWHRTLYESGYVVDFIDPETLNPAHKTHTLATVDLAKYLLIVVPEMFAMPPWLPEALLEVARTGVQIVVAGPSGITQMNCAAYNAWDGYPLRNLTGVTVNEMWPTGVEALGQPPVADSPYLRPDPLTDRITSGVAQPDTSHGIELEITHEPLLASIPVEKEEEPTSGIRYSGMAWAESLSVVADVQVWARYGFGGILNGELGGLPAIVHRKHHEGGVTYLSFDANAKLRDGLCAMLLEQAPGRRDTENTKGVQRIRRGMVEFILNFSDSPVELELMKHRGGAEVIKKIVLPVGAATIHVEDDGEVTVTTYREIVDEMFNTEIF